MFDFAPTISMVVMGENLGGTRGLGSQRAVDQNGGELSFGSSDPAQLC
jgi:hypothetical protein